MDWKVFKKVVRVIVRILKIIARAILGKEKTEKDS